jgi:hypothetical protein
MMPLCLGLINFSCTGFIIFLCRIPKDKAHQGLKVFVEVEVAEKGMIHNGTL